MMLFGSSIVKVLTSQSEGEIRKKFPIGVIRRRGARERMTDVICSLSFLDSLIRPSIY